MIEDGTCDCGGALIFYIVIVIWASRCEPVFSLLLKFLAWFVYLVTLYPYIFFICSHGIILLAGSLKSHGLYSYHMIS